MEAQRVRLTLLIAFVFTFGFFYLTSKPQPGQAAKGNSEPTATATPVLEGPTAENAATNTPVAPTEPQKFAATDVAATAVKPLENDVIRVDLTSRGGSITQIALKQFTNSAVQHRETADDPQSWVHLIPEASPYPGPLTVVEHGSSDAVSRALLEKNWEVREETTPNGLRCVVFAFQTGSGISLEKRYSLTPGSYAIDVELVTRKLDDALGNAKIFRVRAGGGINDVVRGSMTHDPEAVIVTAKPRGVNEVSRHPVSDLESQKTTETDGEAKIAFAGVSNLYFAMLLLPASEEASARTVGATVEGLAAKDKHSTGAELAISLPLNADRSSSSTKLKLYAGPKDPHLLSEQGLDSLQPLVEDDYGSSFRWINKAMLAGLRFFYSLVGNWGLAIMLLTLLVRALVFPITRAQQVSMAKYAAKMKILKPKLDRLKQEMGQDPQRFAQEQMKLLREHGATPPLFGCLSSLITLPVFVGMFQILRTAIELRQAPFVGWIQDLSLPDHLFTIPGIGIAVNVLPIAATAAFIMQIAIQPKPDDPQAQQQQKIMMVMPLVFGVAFYNYAAGLSLYSLTSSALSIFESKVIKKHWPVPGAAVVPAR